MAEMNTWQSKGIGMKESKKGVVMVVDDEEEVRSLLHDFLEAQGYQVLKFSSASDALAFLSSKKSGAKESDYSSVVDLILTDMKMGGLSGMDLLEQVHRDFPWLSVVLMTAFGSIDTAVEAMKLGAYHYVIKPFQLKEVGVLVGKAIERTRLTRENEVLRSELKQNWSLGKIIGKSEVMQRVFDLIRRVGPTTSNVLILGESGTGKEMVARAIHDQADGANRPFIPINCSAIPETLLESELFGHAKGAFTGAVNRKVGLIQEAHGGTLFLDEIGDMSPVLQAKLLRVIQERNLRAVGDNEFHDVDVRFIAATHKDLKALIKDHLFREDLYYRLSVIPIRLPALRERREDIPLLAEHFLRKYSALRGRNGSGAAYSFTERAMARLMTQPWQGNVRELENAIERAVVLCQGHHVDANDIAEISFSDANVFSEGVSGDYPSLEAIEQRYIKLVLERTQGRKDRAADILGINRRTLYRKEREYGWVSELN